MHLEHLVMQKNQKTKNSLKNRNQAQPKKSIMMLRQRDTGVNWNTSQKPKLEKLNKITPIAW